MYRVEWETSASEQFADISMAHPNRWNDINAADNDIGKKLARDPFKNSQAVSEGLRRINSDPLVVYFTVDGNQVNVEAIGWIE
jgi:hypothetical protein